MRKKAKYLHDAPAEALMPGFPTDYPVNGSHGLPSVPGAPSIGSNGMQVSQPGNYYASNPTGSFTQYSPLSQQGQMAPPMIDNQGMIGDQPTFGSPTHFQSAQGQQISPTQDMSAAMDPSNLGPPTSSSFDGPFIDPNDPSLFDFDIADLNFGNRYGALEFGMLGHISSGALNTPDLDMVNSMGQHGSISYDGSTSLPSNFGYGVQFQPWQGTADNGSRQGSSTNIWVLQNHSVDAFAVGENSNSLTGASPNSQNQDFGTGYQSHALSPELQFTQPEQHHQSDATHQTQPQPRSRKPAPFPNDMNQFGFKKRRRDVSEIYASVTRPHNYTQGFHNLTAHLSKKYDSQNVIEIAKALASIRPSFIASNKNLNEDDLTFMEKSFQRSLHETADHFDAIGTLSLVCRRTGEIALINKEFSLVTGWRRDVLLGKEPNLNVNVASSKRGSETGGSNTRGTATPRNPSVEAVPALPQAVLIAEIMDEDSVVQFYRDFSELAFGAPRSSVTRRVWLLKYKTKDDPGWGPEDRLAEDGTRVKTRNEDQNQTKRQPLIKGEAGMKALGDSDGRVDCMLTWTVKRDIFETPMIIAMNVCRQSALAKTKNRG